MIRNQNNVTRTYYQTSMMEITISLITCFQVILLWLHYKTLMTNKDKLIRSITKTRRLKCLGCSFVQLLQLTKSISTLQFLLEIRDFLNTTSKGTGAMHRKEISDHCTEQRQKMEPGITEEEETHQLHLRMILRMKRLKRCTSM